MPPDTPDIDPGGEDVTTTGGMDVISAPTSGQLGSAEGVGKQVKSCIDSWKSKGISMPTLQEIWSS